LRRFTAIAPFDGALRPDVITRAALADPDLHDDE
jgi:hypothetical protein